ncbi:MAG: hypothetical protein JWO78_1958 [Micavibrio sp.]|nr:hypothetical protein [Micavibrio sp.]
MAYPDFLAIEKKPTGFQFDRYTSKGKKVGSTWHESKADALRQVDYEFSGCYSDWHEMPIDAGTPIESIIEHLSVHRVFYRVLLTAGSLPSTMGAKVAEDVSNGFSKLPWNKNVFCFWEGDQNLLFLSAHHPYDDKGIVVGTELVEEIVKSLKLRYLDERTIKIIKVEKFRLNTNNAVEVDI